jgi:Ca-activated chloride channel family protein
MQALEAKDYSKAQAAFAAAIAADPTDPSAAYNRGVAAYRGDDFSVASESFAASGSAGDASLAVASMYNQGTASFAKALRMLPQQSADDGAQQSAELAPAIDSLKTALTHFKDAVAADQRDLDSRFNAELAQRLLRQLEQQQQEQQQQKQDDQNKQEQQNQEQKDSQNKQDQQDQQDQQEQQEQQEQGQEPKENDQQGQQQSQQKDTNQDESAGEKPKDGEQGTEAKDQSEKGGKDKQSAKEDPTKQAEKNNPAKDGSNSSPQSPADSSQDSQATGAKESAESERRTDAPITRNEAERLLQMVRDREKTREDAKERAKQAQPRRAPNGKDW